LTPIVHQYCRMLPTHWSWWLQWLCFILLSWRLIPPKKSNWFIIYIYVIFLVTKSPIRSLSHLQHFTTAL
jgi:hypothetical protein